MNHFSFNLQKSLVDPVLGLDNVRHQSYFFNTYYNVNCSSSYINWRRNAVPYS